MNKALIAWNVLLTALVVYLFTGLSNNPTEVEEPEQNDSSTTEISAEVKPRIEAKVVYINNDTLFKYFEMYEDLQDELVAEKVKLENRYRKELEKLEKDYLELKENAWAMTQAQGEKAQAELVKKQQDLIQMEQDLTKRFAKKETDLVKRIKQTIEDYLEARKEEYGYDFVRSKSGIDGIHFANKDREITYEVIEGLNAEYQAKKEVKKEKK